MISLPQLVDGSVDKPFQNHKVWAKCIKCVIGTTAINHVLFRGVIPCDVLFVGEAPGKTEDATGLPFVGKSGRLLDEWIDDAWFSLGEEHPEIHGDFRYAITNTVCCRPCDRRGGPNRAPSLQEKQNCKPRLLEFVKIARPKLIVAVGKHAQDTIFPKEYAWESIPHPMHAIYNGGRGSPVDLKVRKQLRQIIRSVYGQGLLSNQAS